MPDREHHIVLFGATGFTGALTARYLAATAPEHTRWALAGRSRDKLERLREELAQIDARHQGLPLIEADVNDADSVRRAAESAQVLITTVGPYISYGEPFVAACARAGTDYLDLTGEPEFVDKMWLGYHREAERSGARLIHSCGFDSVPYDLGALYTVGQLPDGVPIKLEGYLRARGAASSGTYQSALLVMGRLRQSVRAAGERRRAEPRLDGRKVSGVTGPPRRDEFAGGWIVPAPTIDPLTILRSARAIDRYGPDFTYSHYVVVRRLPVAAGLIGGVGAAVLLTQIPPARDLLGKLKSSGEGPSPEERERNWFRVRFRGEGDGERVTTEVSGGDPGYGETSKMLAEAALCLAHDELPDRAGQLTPAAAMGEALIERLQRAGIQFRSGV